MGIPKELIGKFGPDVRIISGPTECGSGQEVTVSLPVYISKLAYGAFQALPEFIDLDGRVYRKAGMKASDCTAWYRLWVE